VIPSPGPPQVPSGALGPSSLVRETKLDIRLGDHLLRKTRFRRSDRHPWVVRIERRFIRLDSLDAGGVIPDGVRRRVKIVVET
jgi:hypothetical protein